MSATFPEQLPAKGNGDFKPVPAGNHPGVCFQVLQLGTHMIRYMNEVPKPTPQIRLIFELPSLPKRDDGLTVIVGITQTFSFSEKANFRKMLSTWIGADWHEQLKGKSLGALCGIPGFVNISQEPSKRDPKKVTSFISAVTQFPLGFPVPVGTREHVFLDISSKVIPANITAWDAKTIRESIEYQAGGFQDFGPVYKPRDYDGDGQSDQPPLAPVSNVPPPAGGQPDNRTFEQFARAGIAKVQRIDPDFKCELVLEDVIHSLAEDGLIQIDVGQFPSAWDGMVNLLTQAYAQHRERVRRGLIDAVKYHESKATEGDAF